MRSSSLSHKSTYFEPRALPLSFADILSHYTSLPCTAPLNFRARAGGRAIPPLFHTGSCCTTIPLIPAHLLFCLRPELTNSRHLLVVCGAYAMCTPGCISTLWGSFCWSADADFSARLSLVLSLVFPVSPISVSLLV